MSSAAIGDPDGERPGHDRQPEVDVAVAAEEIEPVGPEPGRQHERDARRWPPSPRRRSARLRHSRRTANQTSPTPGVTFERRMNDQVAGQRNPATIAAAMRISMLPSAIDATTGWRRSSGSDSRPAVQASAAMSSSVQTAGKTPIGRSRNGSHRLAEGGRVEERVVVADVAPAVRVVEPGQVVRLRVLRFGRPAGQLPEGVERADERARRAIGPYRTSRSRRVGVIGRKGGGCAAAPASPGSTTARAYRRRPAAHAPRGIGRRPRALRRRLR